MQSRLTMLLCGATGSGKTTRVSLPSAAAAAILAGAGWTVVASMTFLYGTGLSTQFSHPFYQWWLYELYAPPNGVVTLWLRIGAGVATVAMPAFELGARNKGQNVNYSEVSRPLIRREELLNDCRTDEAFIIARGAAPIRCGRAIYFRRPKFAASVTANRFHKGPGSST